jgi:O-antigen ligase
MPRINATRYATGARPAVSPAVYWTLLFFIFVFPFEAVDLSDYIPGSSSIARLTGMLFIGCYFYKKSRARTGQLFPPLPGALKWFLIYGGVIALRGVFETEGSSSSEHVIGILFTLAQLLVFFWLSAELMSEEKIAMGTLRAYALASCLLALAIFLGLDISKDIGEGRVEVLGENANITGQHFALAGLILIGLELNDKSKRFRQKILLPLFGLFILAGLISLGSRAALSSFIIGCTIYLMPHMRSRRFLRHLGLALVGIAAVLYLAARNPDFVQRWEEFYYERESAGRDEIYAASLDMFAEKPFFGWSPQTAFLELGRRVGWPNGRDTHNTFLDLVLGVGFFGAIPFLVGLGLCGWAAWRARAGALGILPIALLIAQLASNMTHTYVMWKPQWLVLSVGIAAAAAMDRKKYLSRVLYSLSPSSPTRVVPATQAPVVRLKAR